MTYYDCFLNDVVVVCSPKGGLVRLRQSPHVVALTDEERRCLQETTRRDTSPYFDVVRAKVVLLAAEGLENTQIAARLGLPQQIVSKWRKRFCQEWLDADAIRPWLYRSWIFPRDKRFAEKAGRVPVL